jgi:hypothetical protein
MKFRKLAVCLYVLMAVTTLPLFSGNSIFSYKGTPWQFYGNDIYGMSMGDVGLSDVFRKNMGFGNPALVGNASMTLFSTGIMFGWTGYKAQTNKTYTDNSLDFPYFSIAVPINRHRFGFQFNSFASGVVENQRSFSVVDSAFVNDYTIYDTLNIVETQSVNRYIYRADLIYAYRISNISLGFGLNYYLGHDIRRFKQDSGFGIFNTAEKTEQTYKNPSVTIGITSELENISLGAYFSREAILEGGIVRSSIHEAEDLGIAKYSIPNQIGIGFTWKFNNEYKISSDFVYSMWSQTDYSEYSKDSWKLGLGFAQEPTEGTRKTLFGQLSKRFGIHYRALPFDSNGNPLSEAALSAGITIPVKNSENRLDFGIQYMQRGDLNNNLLEDHSFMFLTGIAGFDILSKPFTRTAPREIPKVEELSE